MTTVAVLAANGRSGKAFVEAALAAGLTIRAGIHGQDTLATHENLVTMPCDATKSSDVEKLLKGCDAVVSLIGHTRWSTAHVQTDAMHVVVEAMKHQSIARLVSLTGTGVRQAGDTPSLIDRAATLFISLVDPKRVDDGKQHAALLQSSGLEWTIIRVLKLGAGEHTGRVRFSTTGPAEYVTPRARVAAAIVQIINEHTYVRKMPIIIGKE